MKIYQRDCIWRNEFLILDLTCFYSHRELSDTLRLLENIGRELFWRRGRYSPKPSCLIVPSIVYDYIFEKEVLPPFKDSKKLERVMKKYDKYRARVLRKIKPEDIEKYRQILSELKHRYIVVPSREIVNEEKDKFGRESITFENFRKQLGEAIGRVVFEITMAASKTMSIALFFGSTLRYYIEKVKLVTINTYSKFKEILKRDAKVKRIVNFLAYLSSYQVSLILCEYLETLQDTGTLPWDPDLCEYLIQGGVFVIIDG